MPSQPSSSDESLQVSSSQVKKCIYSFANGSGSGPDGFRPQYFKDMVSISAGSAGVEVLNAITDLCNFMLRGLVNPTVRKYLFGGVLCAFKKEIRGIRPIAIGLSIRRLVAKLACKHAYSVIGDYFEPLGFISIRRCSNGSENIHELLNKTFSLKYFHHFMQLDKEETIKILKKSKELQKSITDLVACKPLAKTTCLRLRNPQAADDIYIPTWPHFNSLTFLDDSAPNRTSLCTYITQDWTAVCVKQLFRPNSKGSYKIKQEIVVEECLEILRSVKEGSSSSASSDTPKDSCECYGEYVTACLKAMSQWNQALAMADISNILIKYHPNNPNL
ncbi:hypothetical protein Bhyg_09200 [Pseudolycoriella hygida]|uniref:Uncharacterized protein n=1 Tax=Pseudolycoriella hygida TaxID=35572 RepID=A0A9Q0S519_9DIPT|nr:hypothetical protein Bhyg_09200 [Pseudolycoriella hygida]